MAAWGHLQGMGPWEGPTTDSRPTAVSMTKWERPRLPLKCSVAPSLGLPPAEKGEGKGSQELDQRLQKWRLFRGPAGRAPNSRRGMLRKDD